MKHFHHLKYAALFIIGFALIAGFGWPNGPITSKGEAAASASFQKKSDDDDKGAIVAEAQIEPTAGNEVKGSVKFIQKKDRVHIISKLQGLPPGRHGFHLHQHGNCGDNGMAAGGHYNPTGTPHGSPDNDVSHRHVGDLGNLEANHKGDAHDNRFDNVIKLSGPQSVIGLSVIIHANPDDFVTQPTGNAGARIGCGVIKQIK